MAVLYVAKFDGHGVSVGIVMLLTLEDQCLFIDSLFHKVYLIENSLSL